MPVILGLQKWPSGSAGVLVECVRRCVVYGSDFALLSYDA